MAFFYPLAMRFFTGVGREISAWFFGIDADCLRVLPFRNGLGMTFERMKVSKKLSKINP
jgi:hypothetical protein